MYEPNDNTSAECHSLFEMPLRGEISMDCGAGWSRRVGITVTTQSSVPELVAHP